MAIIDFFFLLHGNSRLMTILFIPPRGGASWRLYLFRLALAPHGNSLSPALWWRLTAILIIPPRGGASRQFFLSRLAMMPIGDSFYPAPIQESSHPHHLLTYFYSVRHSLRVAWPAHILSHPHGIKYLTSMSILSFVLLWYPPWERGLLDFLLGDSGMGPVLFHAHILVSIEHPPHSNESSWFGIMFWLMNLPFMSNIFVLRDTAKPSSPRTILQHAAVSRPRLTICIASICSVRSKLSQSIDSVFFLSFREYYDLSHTHTRPLKSFRQIHLFLRG
jgi:hypothetical protein